MTAKKVFISYSHDSPEHEKRVAALAERLRSQGIDCIIDQYISTPAEGWPRWMVNQIEWADFVLVVATETYERRFRGHEERGKGLGAQWEGAISTQQLYNENGNNLKFVPIVFASSDVVFIPLVLQGATWYNVASEDSYHKLFSYLTGQSPYKPTLGTATQNATSQFPLGRVADAKVCILRFAVKRLDHREVNHRNFIIKVDGQVFMNIKTTNKEISQQQFITIGEPFNRGRI